MKRLFAMMAFLLCVGVLPMTVWAEGTEDLWQGSLDVGGIKLRLVVHVNKSADGKFSGTLDSPDQGAKGIAMTVDTYDKNTLKVSVPSISGVFEGKLTADGKQAIGGWRQGGTELPLTLTKGGPLLEVRRPQTPQAPFPYETQDVTFVSKPGVVLAGTLTLPRATTGPVPAVLLIAGSGPNNRNEAILNHQVFLVLADYLTRRGIAVLRYDKRGIGQSTGSYAQATSADFADDAEAGIAYLKGRSEVDGTKIGLIGHSEGGLIAPMVAARNKSVSFVVMMAGPGLNGEEILYRQSALIARASGEKEEEIAANHKMQTKLFGIVKSVPDADLAQKRMRAEVDSFWTGLTDAQRAALKSKDTLYAQCAALSSPWMRYFLVYDPLPALKKVTCPVLALNGSRDLQVPCQDDLSRIEAALKAGGNTHYTIKELPNLNHLFQNCTTGSPLEYGNIEETMSPVALQTMGDWIAQQTGAK